MAPLIAALLPILGGIIDKVIPDSAAADKAKLEMQMEVIKQANEGLLAQIDLNKTEAATGNVFVGGWRPFIGWVCGAALAFQFVAGPLIEWAAAATGHAVPPLPKLDDMLWELVLAMLGIGGLRTVEKIKGVAR